MDSKYDRLGIVISITDNDAVYVIQNFCEHPIILLKKIKRCYYGN